MPDSLRHVSIHCAVPPRAEPGPTVDVSLPAALTVGELLPWIVDEFGVGDATPRRWQLADLGGRRLDESATLAQNDIRDGDLLVLSSVEEGPSFEQPPVTTLTVGAPQDGVPTGLRIVGCLWLGGLGVAALAWTGSSSHGWGRIAAAAAMFLVATVAATVASRRGVEAGVVTALNVTAVLQGAILGFLVVPAGPAAANAFLAAVAAGSLGVVLLRVSGCGTEVLLAIVTAAALVAVTTGAAVWWPLDTSSVGAFLAALAVGLLPVTPRLSLALAGLTPPMPGEPVDAGTGMDRHVPDVDAAVDRCRRNLAGLVWGCAAAAALGSVVLACAAARARTVEIAFAAVVGVALLLRARGYACRRCQTGLLVGGFWVLTATFALVVTWLPHHGNLVGMLVVGAGIGLLSPVTVRHPRAGRLADTLEYATLAAVLPLGVWLTGAFDLVPGLGLS
ncbi:type VII secretion integral membrane protein EccD [Mycobacterium sp. TNTM28]|uniref:Type VII secretion integral membrane protein EccD n=1 Tax=[Mycobacterium] fortunisiensis TaxID=2600579 RepID=A0ABS6KJM4_9MYCO|nr:type VII secretion integral membrane protein EccD [[Mycobacterium] fortunisiensis]MBU9763777.1 type VII secretion integral membrane protein EccD [[Mycobacterium] fortunisiensis]